jgi:hypothetical protein
VLGKRAITPDTALRLSLFFGLSERFWINLQTRYDIEVEKDKLQDRLKNECIFMLKHNRGMLQLVRGREMRLLWLVSIVHRTCLRGESI